MCVARPFCWQGLGRVPSLQGEPQGKRPVPISLGLQVFPG